MALGKSYKYSRSHPMLSLLPAVIISSKQIGLNLFMQVSNIYEKSLVTLLTL